jgi:hypothetical protein
VLKQQELWAKDGPGDAGIQEKNTRDIDVSDVSEINGGLSPLATGLYPQIRWYSRGLSFIAINVTLAILGIHCEKKHLKFWTNEMAAMSTDHWNAAKQTAMQSMRPNYCNPCRPVFRLGSQIKPI